MLTGNDITIEDGASCEPYDQHWNVLGIELGEGPPIGIDAVIHTRICNGKKQYVQWIENHNRIEELTPNGSSPEGPPDATPDNCLENTSLTMNEGDFVLLQLNEAVQSGDTIEVVAVEPDGTCRAAETTSHIKVFIATGAGFGSEVLIGEGAAVTVPERDGIWWVVP